MKYEDLPNFLKVAEALQVKGLHGEVRSRCVSIFMSEILISNFFLRQNF